MNGLFTTIETVLQLKLQSILNTYITLFADKMVILLQAGAPILVLYYGYSLMTGRGSTANMGEMLWNMARIGIVFEFMKNTGGLLDLSISFIHELKSGFVGEKSIFALLDQQFAITQKLAEDLYNLDVDYIKFRGFFAGLMLWFGSVVVLVAAAIVFISADVGLVLLTATAPIFIGCLTYGFLKEMFNGWLRSIFSCIITLIFASMIVRIGVDINTQLIQSFADSPVQNTLMTIGVLSLSSGIIVSFLTLKAAGLAGNIAGVAASSAIQGGTAAAAAVTSRLGYKALGMGSKAIGGGVSYGANNFKENTKEALANRAKLTEANMKAAIARVQQQNLNS